MTVLLLRASAPRRVIAGAAALAFVGFGALTGLTSAGAAPSYPVVVPIPETSNQTCAELAAYLTAEEYFPTLPTWTETKIDPPANASDVGPAEFSVTGLVNTETGPPSFNWSSTSPIAIVYVKSGQGASQVYLYDPATGATSGTGLTTNGGKQISHISACFGAATPPPTPPTPPPTPPTPPPTPPAPPTPAVQAQQVGAGAQAPAAAVASRGAYTG